MTKPNWLREQEKRLKKEFDVNYGKPIKASEENLGMTHKTVKIELEDPETVAERILKILKKKFGVHSSSK